MMSLRDKEALYSTKEEDDATNTSTMAPSSSSRQWSSGLKNPRIVRVSRTFGGKDRHSKVCTIKGLRDRRIRLSVPTAIQLYDLQDRLGLGQPSKVIDWLLDTTKLDIDKLPPLPPIPGTFDPFQQSIHMSQGYGASQSSLNPFFDANLISSRRGGGININSECVDINEDPSIVAKLKYWDSNATIRSKQKEIDDDQGTIGEGSSGNNQVLAQNFFPIASSNNNNASILPPSTFLSNHHHPMYNYYHHWEPSNLSLTQFGNHGLLSSQNAHHHSSNSSSLSSPLALSSGSSQLFLSPSMASASTHYPHNHASYVSNHPQLENDIRQFNRSPLSSNNNNNNPFTSIPHYNTSSSDLGLKPFPLSMSHHPQLHQSNDDDDHQQHDKNNHGSWKESSRN